MEWLDSGKTGARHIFAVGRTPHVIGGGTRPQVPPPSPVATQLSKPLLNYRQRLFSPLIRGEVRIMLNIRNGHAQKKRKTRRAWQSQT